MLLLNPKNKKPVDFLFGISNFDRRGVGYYLGRGALAEQQKGVKKVVSHDFDV